MINQLITQSGGKDAVLCVALSQLSCEFRIWSRLSLERFFCLRHTTTAATGSLRLDLALGTGGLPKGKIVESMVKRSQAKPHLRFILSRKLKSLEITGSVYLQVLKNKLAPAMKKAELEIIFRKGFTSEARVLDMACTHGVIFQTKNGYVMKGEVLQDKKAAETYLSQNHEILEKLS